MHTATILVCNTAVRMSIYNLTTPYIISCLYWNFVFQAIRSTNDMMYKNVEWWPTWCTRMVTGHHIGTFLWFSKVINDHPNCVRMFGIHIIWYVYYENTISSFISRKLCTVVLNGKYKDNWDNHSFGYNKQRSRAIIRIS